jgi:O-antigen/teichoic acid export membrane protein
VSVPRLAALRSEGAGRVVGTGRTITLAVATCGVLYAVALATLYPFASAALLGAKYQGLGVLIVPWCMVVLMQLVRDGASTILQTLHEFRRLTLSGAMVGCLALPITAAMAHAFGAQGAVWATAATECALAIVLWAWVTKHAR